MLISDYLPTGKENAVTGGELAAVLNMPVREIERALQRERRGGRAICASTGERPGYYLAANRAELEDYCKNLYKRGGELMKTRRMLLKTLDGLPDDPRA